MESLIKHFSIVRSANPRRRIVALLIVALSTLAGTAACGLPFMQTNTPFPTLFVPTPDCGSPTLVIDSSPFQIQTLTPASDGSLAVPPDTAGIAYWIEGTGPNYVFVVNRAPIDLSTITIGSAAKVTWQNCNSTTYSLSSAPESSSLSVVLLADQSVQGITIFFQTDASGAGMVVRGELTGEQISTFNTPASDASEVQVEVGLLETTASTDGTTIRIGVSINNWGGSAFTLSASDVSLVLPDNTTLTMVSSEPILPKEVKPAATENFSFTFPRPAAQSATLKIFTVELDIQGY